MTVLLTKYVAMTTSVMEGTTHAGMDIHVQVQMTGHVLTNRFVADPIRNAGTTLNISAPLMVVRDYVFVLTKKIAVHGIQ
jgi:hypothetical protein